MIYKYKIYIYPGQIKKIEQITPHNYFYFYNLHILTN